MEQVPSGIESLNGQGPFHFVGIGGISMSGIARLLLEKGYQVSGSDLKDSNALDNLRQAGARINTGHEISNLGQARVVVVSAAVPEENCEVQEARRRGIPVWQRAEMIARIMADKKGIAVAGTHGKTTTTSMVSLVLEKYGLDPTVLIGGELNDLGGNAKLGRGEVVVTEADESDGSFLFLSPHIALINNIELDHPDYYSSYQMVLDVFQRFVKKVAPQGQLIMGCDDPGVKELLSKVRPAAPVLTFGCKEGDLQAGEIELASRSSVFNVYFQGRKLGSIKLNVPGRHNVYNALGVVGIGLTLGLNFEGIKMGLEAYQGVQRRFEPVGNSRGLQVIDDYAHHPTEIAATIAAARSENPGRILAIFQPHRFTRTAHFMDKFVQALGQADRVIITPIYAASEEPIPGVSGEKLAELLGARAVFCAKMEKIPELIAREMKEGDLLLTLGAGDIHQVGPLVLDYLKSGRAASSGQGEE